MPDSPTDLVLPIEGGKQQEPRQAEPPDLRHWQIEGFCARSGRQTTLSAPTEGSWCALRPGAISPSSMSHPAISGSIDGN